MLAPNPSASGTVDVTIPSDFAAGYQLYVFAEQVNAAYITDYASELVQINIADQTAPTGLAGITPNSIANNDGKITGVTTYMEYSADNGATWQTCSDTELIGLVPGSYQVRYKAGAIESDGTVRITESLAETITISSHGQVAAPTANPKSSAVSARHPDNAFLYRARRGYLLYYRR